MFKRILNSVIRGYQLFISPLFGNHCRYYPSCSEYARQAIEQHGMATGSRLAVARILRCNPFSYGGVDHVPCKQHKKLPENKNTMDSAANECRTGS